MGWDIAFERRSAARVHMKGSVVVRSLDRSVLGRLLDLATTSMRIECSRACAPHELVGVPLDIEVRLDGALGGWVRFTGRATTVRRQHELVIALDRSSLDLDGTVETLLARARAHENMIDVMIVDENVARRTATAAAFREEGCWVVEAATPYGVIARLEGTRPSLIAVADTLLAGASGNLRRFLRGTHPATRIVATGDAATSRVTDTWLCTSNVDHALPGRIRALLRTTADVSPPEWR
jgi:CheY-like chemotaxis protein